MEYKESKSFYHTAAWKRAREQALRRDRGMCRDCMARFEGGAGKRPHRAEMVHHIIPIDQRPDLALTLSNLVSLCNECHARRHPEKGRTGGRQTQRQTVERVYGHKMRVEKV